MTQHCRQHVLHFVSSMLCAATMGLAERVFLGAGKDIANLMNTWCFMLVLDFRTGSFGIRSETFHVFFEGAPNAAPFLRRKACMVKESFIGAIGGSFQRSASGVFFLSSPPWTRGHQLGMRPTNVFSRGGSACGSEKTQEKRENNAMQTQNMMLSKIVHGST